MRNNKRKLRILQSEHIISIIMWIIFVSVSISISGSVLWMRFDIEKSIDAQGQALEKTDEIRFITKERNRIIQERMRSVAVLLPTAAPVPPDMDRMKREGCVADGLLSGYGDEKRNIKLINRLPCYYLHRAVETWLDPPQWGVITDIMSEITQSPVVYGMFIAEAIDTKAQYWNEKDQEWFDFKKMCKNGTKDFWGYRTCVPSFDEKEYRHYVEQIMKEGIDHGVQVFLIGQVYMQDARHLDDSEIEDVLNDVRAYADRYGVEIFIGAQTNTISDKDYLQLFDFVEGGTGLHSNGSIEDSRCFSRWDSWCWALLWHESYQKKAPDTFIHLDWSGAVNDDMATFVQMSSRQRSVVLQKLHTFFTAQDVGFLLPVLTALPRTHEGCYGNQEWYYSADRKYSCDDEDIIKSILTNK